MAWAYVGLPPTLLGSAFATPQGCVCPLGGNVSMSSLHGIIGTAMQRIKPRIPPAACGPSALAGGWGSAGHCICGQALPTTLHIPHSTSHAATTSWTDWQLTAEW